MYSMFISSIQHNELVFTCTASGIEDHNLWKGIFPKSLKLDTPTLCPRSPISRVLAYRNPSECTDTRDKDVFRSIVCGTVNLVIAHIAE